MFKEYREYKKRTKTIRFVIDAITKDLDKISKKSKEYQSMKIRKTNLQIVECKRYAKINQFMIDTLRYSKKVSS